MTKDRFIQRLLFVCAIGTISALYGCGHIEKFDGRLELAESLMETDPDSSLHILNSFEESDLVGCKSKARYALLKSMALDKNYVDTTTFDVLQPAIDYYLKNGSPDEKLRTYYYQSVIFKNAGEDDLAMQAHLNALENGGLFSDSLTLARLFVAQGALFYKQYRISDFINNNLKAAAIYGSLGNYSKQMQCYSRAINGETLMKNKAKVDSILRICKRLLGNNPSLNRFVVKQEFRYSVNFENEDSVREKIQSIMGTDITQDIRLDLALAYTKIGEPEKGLHLLNQVEISSDDILDSLTYWSVKSEIFENLGKDRQALDAFRNYSRVLEMYHDQLFSNELLFSEKKHAMEMESMAKIQRKDKIIQWIIIAAVILLFLVALTYYRYRINKTGRLLAESKADNLQLEGDRQRLLAEKLESERRELKLEAENLHLQIGELEDERERLNDVLEKQEELSADMRRIIRHRLEMLNGLFASEISKDENYAKEYRKYVKTIWKDKKKFQDSLRKDLKAAHPEFMSFLTDQGLTDKEIDYVCLYAIGLRGKEIGNYLEVSRHYIVSSEIRRKLGLESHDVNLGPFLRGLMNSNND